MTIGGFPSSYRPIAATDTCCDLELNKTNVSVIGSLIHVICIFFTENTPTKQKWLPLKIKDSATLHSLYAVLFPYEVDLQEEVTLYSRVKTLAH